MKIAHLSDCYLPRLGGIEMQVHDLAARQAAAGNQVAVITATPGDRPERAERPERPGLPDHPGLPGGDGVAIHRVSAGLPYELPVHPRAGRAVRRLLLDGVPGGFDVAHVHAGVLSPFAFAAARACLRAGVPTVVTVHCLWGYATPLFRLFDAGVGWSRWPVVLTAVSRAAAEPIRRVAGADRPVGILPNGIDPAFWRVQPAGGDPGEVHLVSVMRLAPRKRSLQLLRMLRRVRDRVPAELRLRATIVGDGPERRMLDRYRRRYGMQSWVHLPGRLPRERIRDLYRGADVYVAPAILESFGIAALEARCAGLPVVARASSGVREFVEHGRHGLLAASDADMVAEIVALACSPARRQELAATNRAAEPAATWTGVLELTAAAYEQAAELMADAGGRSPAGRSRAGRPHSPVG